MVCCRMAILSHGWPNCTAGEIPGQVEFQRRVGSTLPDSYNGFDWSRLELPIAVAATLILIHARLAEAVRRIEARIEHVDAAQRKCDEADQPRSKSVVADLVELYGQFPRKNDLPTQEPSGPKEVAFRFDDGFPEQHEYGPLGIGLDVLGAIAFRQAERTGMQVDTRQLETLRAQSERVYRRASEVLRTDRSIVGRLKWEQGTVVRDPSGAPANARVALEVTLKQKQKELFDRIECDPLIPQKVRDRLSETAVATGYLDQM